MTIEAQEQTLGFEAEVKQLLSLVAHSLYSNKEIFLRELVSNASDAADKLRYEALTDAALYETDPELKIIVEVDKKAHTITLCDNGIGMSREEVIENLGTIAKSGTRAFRELLENNKKDNSQLIGQFGVGFYSAFIVSDRVVVRTRRAGAQADQGVYWESNGEGEYTIKNVEKALRGTEVILYIKKEAEEFLDEFRLRTIIKKYSDHILLPIMMPKMQMGDDKKEEVSDEFEAVNKANALWTLPKNEITQEQYEQLYQDISHDYEPPLMWNHSRVEGKTEYTNLLYIPKHAPFDLWQREPQKGLKLYVRHVFIMDNAEHFLPNYLRFVKGIIDSNDLPLNISRELLQANQLTDQMRAGCVKKILGMLEDMLSQEPEKYKIFWKEFGQVLKEGPAEDFANKDRIAKLLRFASTHENTEDQNVSIADYAGRMKDGQNKIYYITADTFTSAKNSPLLEVFRKKGIEVLLLTDRVDEWLVAHFPEFEGKQFQSVAKGKLDFDDKEDKQKDEELKQEEQNFESVLKQVREVLGDKVKEVRLTHRLVDSPACVVFDENDMGGHLARLMKAAGQAIPGSKPILELNPEHRIIMRLKEEADDTRFARWTEVLLAQALLAEGEQLEDPAAFVKQLNELLLS